MWTCDAQFVKGTHIINLALSGYYRSHYETNYGDTANYYTNNVTYNNYNFDVYITPSFGFFLKENLMLSVGPV